MGVYMQFMLAENDWYCIIFQPHAKYASTSSSTPAITKYVHMHSTLAKLVVWEENEGNAHPIHHAQTVRVCRHKMSRTHECPASIAVLASQRSLVISRYRALYSFVLTRQSIQV